MEPMQDDNSRIARPLLIPIAQLRWVVLYWNTKDSNDETASGSLQALSLCCSASSSDCSFIKGAMSGDVEVEFPDFLRTEVPRLLQDKEYVVIPYLLAASLDESERESLRAFVSQARSADYTNNPIWHFLVWSAINGKTGSTIQDWIKSEEAGNVLEELRLAWTEVCHSPKFVFIVLSVLGFRRLMNLSEPDLHQCFKESICEENEEAEDDQVDRFLFPSLGGFVEGKIAITEFNIHQLIAPLRDAVQNEYYTGSTTGTA
ncbi:hypothetical protein CCUS01_06565 [Colletotrichum cuscutae]|uniref:Uncharacterized protein n=1 Tax=Colletotrichum cuscutae TaxID=1209917 RepID=A0AAI9Y2N2_9PEZI|nr:hypothetical protein CCUS01_06565 [Colletotrichum cuscutae]